MRATDSGRVGKPTGLSQAETQEGLGPAGFDPSRVGVRCSDGDRPAREPGGVECGRCGCIFIGEEWHEFCALCITSVAREIAALQGRLVMREPEFPCDSDRNPEGRDAEERLGAEHESAGPKDIAQPPSGQSK